MKNRTCPNCGFKYNFFRYSIKSMFRIADSIGQCPDCNSLLTYKPSSRFITIVGSILPVVLNKFIIGLLADMGISKLYSWLIFVIVSLVWILVLCGFEKLTLRKEIKPLKS